MTSSTASSSSSSSSSSSIPARLTVATTVAATTTTKAPATTTIRAPATTTTSSIAATTTLPATTVATVPMTAVDCTTVITADPQPGDVPLLGSAWFCRAAGLDAVAVNPVTGYKEPAPTLPVTGFPAVEASGLAAVLVLSGFALIVGRWWRRCSPLCGWRE